MIQNFFSRNWNDLRAQGSRYTVERSWGRMVSVRLIMVGRVALDVDKSSADHTPVVVSGTGEGSWEKGMWDYKALPLPGAQIQEDDRLGASWSFEP